MTKERAPAVIASVAAAVLFMLAIGAPPALADTATYDLTVDDCSGGCGTSPFGQVTLTQVGTSVDIVVTLFNGNEFVMTGAGENYDFKLDGDPGGTPYAGPLTLSQFTVTDPTGPALAVAGGPGSAFDGDGTGHYGFGIDCPSCSMGASGDFTGPIDITVTNATISELTTANEDGLFFTADILGSNGHTGPVAASGAVSAPEASSVTLASLVLLAFGGLLVRARRELA